MSTETMKSGGQVRANAYLSIDYRKIHKEYRYARAWGAKVNAYDKLSKFHSLSARILCAELGIELAAEAVNSKTAELLVNRAVESAHCAKALTGSVCVTDPKRVIVERLLPNMPALITQKVHREQPTLAQLTNAYETHVKRLIPLHRVALPSLQVNDPKRQDYEGQLAESYVLLSLQKFALQNFSNTDWMPLPAIGSENSTGAKGCVTQPTWAVSIRTYMGNETTEDPTYKVQVKRQFSSMSAQKIYDDDITMVYVKNDLALDFEQNVESDYRFVSMNRLFAETMPDATIKQQERWDLRTDILVDMLG